MAYSVSQPLLPPLIRYKISPLLLSTQYIPNLVYFWDSPKFSYQPASFQLDHTFNRIILMYLFAVRANFRIIAAVFRPFQALRVVRLSPYILNLRQTFVNVNVLFLLLLFELRKTVSSLEYLLLKFLRST